MTEIRSKLAIVQVPNHRNLFVETICINPDDIVRLVSFGSVKKGSFYGST